MKENCSTDRVIGWEEFGRSLWYEISIHHDLDPLFPEKLYLNPFERKVVYEGLAKEILSKTIGQKEGERN